LESGVWVFLGRGRGEIRDAPDAGFGNAAQGDLRVAGAAKLLGSREEHEVVVCAVLPIGEAFWIHAVRLIDCVTGVHEIGTFFKE
jgi:hypothetical protein